MRGQPYLTQIKDRDGKLKSPFWHVEWYDTTANRNKRCTTGCRIGEEDAAANTYLAQFIIQATKPVSRTPEEMLLAHALKDYWDEHLQYSQDTKNAKYVQDRVKSNFGHLLISQIIQAEVDKYTRKCQAQNQSNGTIRKTLEHLRGAINHAIKNNRITHAPRIKLPPPPAPREKILTVEEVELILLHCKSDHVRNSIILMLNTGQRPSAISELTWFQVDLKEGVIHFQKNGKRESNKRVRPVFMNQETRELLTELHGKRLTEYVIEYIIKNKNGEVVKARPAGNIKKAFARACIGAGLLPADAEERKRLDKDQRIGRYTLRHTFANILEAEDKARSDIMGHTNTETTNRHYLKANREKQLKALEALPKLRRNYAEGITQISGNG